MPPGSCRSDALGAWTWLIAKRSRGGRVKRPPNPRQIATSPRAVPPAGEAALDAVGQRAYPSRVRVRVRGHATAGREGAAKTCAPSKRCLLAGNPEVAVDGHGRVRHAGEATLDQDVDFTPGAKRRAVNIVQEVVPLVEVVLLRETTSWWWASTRAPCSSSCAG